MNRTFNMTVITGLVGLTLVTGLVVERSMEAMAASGGAKMGHGAKGKRVPVIVELFTSEGCSSCPSADAELMRLQKEQPVADAQIIPLSEHVDYWNGPSWSDPFSSHAFSQRQNAYSDAFHLNEVYTPQAVVDGQQEFIGSDGDKAEAAIAHSAQLPKASVQIAPTGSGAFPGGVQVSVENLPTLRRGNTAEVMLAITENNLHSSVLGGENGGRHLSHTAVVRQLRSIGTATPGQTFSAAPTLTLKSTWKRNDLTAVVFVQESQSKRILGAAALPLAGK